MVAAVVESDAAAVVFAVSCVGDQPAPVVPVMAPIIGQGGEPCKLRYNLRGICDVGPCPTSHAARPVAAIPVAGAAFLNDVGTNPITWGFDCAIEGHGLLICNVNTVAGMLP